MSVMDLISEIKKKEPDLEINNIGEADFIITFKNKPGSGLVWQWCKIIFVGLAAFFGAGFSIMTFNNDVDAVSYTHLDVYKRQFLRLAAEEIILRQYSRNLIFAVLVALLYRNITE